MAYPNPRNARGIMLTSWMVTFGLKRRWYEFDFLARLRLTQHLKRIGLL